MTVIISSFKESDKILKPFPDIECFSVSRWQPKGYVYPTFEFLGAYDKNGSRLYLRNSSLERYKHQWKEYIASNWAWVEDWLNSLDNEKDIMLCCWCPHSKSTQNQMKQFGTFVCHTGLIGRLINKYRPDIHLFLDFEHAQYLVPEYKPFKFRIIDY